MVDKNLFLYDLAIVAIMKNEGSYVKEWLDYHLLAGADHFYIYDNESPDNQREVLQPYIDAGIVTYIFYPGKARQYEAYNDAFKNFKFQCRYIAFIDGDEFILPKSKSTIAEVVDEILSPNPNSAALGANWIFYGSNHQDTADYTRGVLDRFTVRGADVDKQIKSITNPRKIKFFLNPHYAIYFEGQYSVNELGNSFFGPFNDAKTADKICINHYHTKSREEWDKKVERGNPDGTMKRDVTAFSHDTNNDVMDVGILKYRDARRAAIIPEGYGIESLFPRKQINHVGLINALIQNLFQTTIKGTPQDFFNGKIENFLTCLNLTAYLKEKYLEDTAVKFFEESSLNAILRSLQAGVVGSDLLLLLSEMPKILKMNYPAVESIRDTLIKFIPQMMIFLRMSGHWQEFNELDNTLEMLKSFK